MMEKRYKVAICVGMITAGVLCFLLAAYISSGKISGDLLWFLLCVSIILGGILGAFVTWVIEKRKEERRKQSEKEGAELFENELVRILKESKKYVEIIERSNIVDRLYEKIFSEGAPDKYVVSTYGVEWTKENGEEGEIRFDRFGVANLVSDLKIEDFQIVGGVEKSKAIIQKKVGENIVERENIWYIRFVQVSDPWDTYDTYEPRLNQCAVAGTCIAKKSGVRYNVSIDNITSKACFQKVYKTRMW